MVDTLNISLDREGFDKHVQTLTPSQRVFANLFLDWVKLPRKMMVLISGGPGTGKTYAVKELLKFVKVEQLTMAYTARIAQNIGGRTIHSTLQLPFGNGSVQKSLEDKNLNEMDTEKCLKESEVLLQQFKCFEDPTIVMIDEIAMIPYYLSYWVVRFFMDRTSLPLLMICMGDGHQLLPVRSTHNIFGLDLAVLKSQFETHQIVFTESKRFTKEYEPMVERLRSFVDTGDDTGMFTYLCSTFPVVEDIDADMLKKCTRVLAFRNTTVDNYNRYYVHHMMSGPVTRLYRWNTLKKMPIKDSYVEVKPECKIFVTQNGCSEVSNGASLIFERYCSAIDVIECRHPVTRDPIRVRRNNFGSFPVVLGFASTVHKFQGETIDDEAIAINFDGSRDLNLVYTALSRVRYMHQILAIAL